MTLNPIPNSPSSSGEVPALALIGITGGIASGKSYVCERLERAGHRVFYCDDEAKRILRTDPAVQSELTALVGPDLYDAQGTLVKSVLAAYLCRGREYAAKVDAVVHPRVAAAFIDLVERLTPRVDVYAPRSHRARFADDALNDYWPLQREQTVSSLAALPPGRVLFMECALLFEAGFDRLVHHSVLVHATEATRLKRLMARDGISSDKAREWMDLQLSEDEKLRLAQSVIVNE